MAIELSGVVALLVFYERYWIIPSTWRLTIAVAPSSDSRKATSSRLSIKKFSVRTAWQRPWPGKSSQDHGINPEVRFATLQNQSNNGLNLQLNHYVENNAGYSKILVAVLVLVAVYLASLDGFIEFVSIYEGFARNLEGVDLAFLDESVESGASDPEVLTCLIKTLSASNL